MTSLLTAYTPLETLLLFQALRFEGLNSHSVFSRVSDQLKNVPLVRGDPTFDDRRLGPDALRELCLQLLKEEVKRDLDRELERESLLLNGDVSPGSRKRKAASPTLPTVHEASQHAHLIPQLVIRLYSRYREHAIRDIREHERRYDDLTREINEIGAGEWDERLQRQSPIPSTSSHPRPKSEIQDHAHPAKSRNDSPKSAAERLDSGAQTKPFTENKIGSLINAEPEQSNGANGHRRSSSTTTLPRLSEMAPQSPLFGIPPKIPGPVPTQTHGPGLSQSPQSPFAPSHTYPLPAPLASPQTQNSLSRPSSSPRPTLPPPPGMTLPPPSPQHIGSPSLRGPSLPQQYYPPQPPPHRLSTGASSTNDYPMPGYPASHFQPHAGADPQQQPYLDHRTSNDPPQQHTMPAVYSIHERAQNGGLAVPPISTDMGRPIRAPPGGSQPMGHELNSAQQPLNYAQGPSSHPQQPPSAPSTAPRPVRPANTNLVSNIIAALATPPRPQQRPVVWKSERRRLSLKDPSTPLPSPDYEPLSPTFKRGDTSGRSTRSARNRADTKPGQSAEPESLPTSTRNRGRLKRDRSPLSIVSSTADESARLTRSQSVSTVTGALPTSFDRPGSRGKVKVEPSTPAGFVEEVDSTNDAGSGGRTTRKRRGTLQSQLQQQTSKRKRQSSPSENREDEPSPATPPPKPNTIVATRNFHKLSATIMNDINSHKHASYFANMVRDKDAPGYSEIIMQPQHLRSIRLAIAAGNKSVNAAAIALDSPSTSGTPTAATSKTAADGSTVVELERSIDLMPPKAIVNAAQLEKEVVRMFANAVMFNPGDDGMVRDTREMFEDVDVKMREWRGAEKEAVENDEEEGKVKRRKM